MKIICFKIKLQTQCCGSYLVVGLAVFFNLKSQTFLVLICAGMELFNFCYIHCNLKMFRGLLDRYGTTSFNLLAVEGQELSILVENQGRINFGSQILNNRKVGLHYKISLI